VSDTPCVRCDTHEATQGDAFCRACLDSLRLGAGPIPDPIRPPHYQEHPSGFQCIQVTEHMNFCMGNAVKYIWRAGLKGSKEEDLRKAIWYLERELEKTSNE